LSNLKKQRRAADRGSAVSRVRKVATSDGSGWSPFISVAIALVVLLGWLTWYALGHRPLARDGTPSWSADATQIVFDAEQNGQRDILVMNADGTNVHPLTNIDASDEAAPAWSPAGTDVAYEADVDGNRDIYLINANGTHKQRLTDHPAIDQSPAWSRDGRKIVFTSDRDSKPSFDLYQMNADGSGVERLTTSGDNGAPQYSPDGMRIAFHSGRDIYVLDLATRKLHRLTNQSQTGDGLRPTWSPDGKQLAFMTARGGRMQIWVMNADGSDPRELVEMPTGSAIDPRWSPNDDRILFVHVPDDVPPAGRRSSGERALYVLDIGSGKVTRLSR
jgi:TolB protein